MNNNYYKLSVIKTLIGLKFFDKLKILNYYSLYIKANKRKLKNERITYFKNNKP